MLCRAWKKATLISLRTIVCNHSKMLKVVEWVVAAVLGFAVWISAVLNVHSWHLTDLEKNAVLYVSIEITFALLAITSGLWLQFPVYAVLLAGVTSVLIIAYRVATFKDCPEAALELQKVRNGSRFTEATAACPQINLNGRFGKRSQGRETL